MSEGKYKLERIPEGKYDAEAAKEGYTPEKVENIEVIKDTTIIVDFKLKGGDNMATYTEAIVIEDASEKKINVPVIEPEVPVKFVKTGLETPLIDKQVELLSEDENTVLQIKTTNADGLVIFVNVVHGRYKVRITY